MPNVLSRLFHCVGIKHASAQVSASKCMNLLVLGMENSGKTTTCLQVHDNLKKGVTPTTGLTKFKPLPIRGYDVILYDMGGADGTRKMWKSYFAKVHGIVFVVDSSKKDLKITAGSLRSVLLHPQVKGKPVLILANKQDLPDSRFAIRISEALGLKDILSSQDDVYMISECASNDPHFATIRNSLEWIASKIDMDFQKINTRVLTDTKDQEMKDKEEAKQRKSKVDKIKEKRALALAAAEAENPDGKRIQICLECNDAVATKKTKESSFRPVCDKCHEKCAAAYKKKTKNIRCILCNEPAVKKSGKVGWKPVCKSCNDRLNAGETKEDILASPAVKSSEATSDVKEESKKEKEVAVPTKKKEHLTSKKEKKEDKMNLEKEIEGSYRTGNGETEHIRCCNKTSYEVFSEDSDISWGTIELGTYPTFVVKAKDDGATFSATVSKKQDELLITWCDGDTWTRKERRKRKKNKKKKNKKNNEKKQQLSVDTTAETTQAMKNLQGRWRTNANTYEIARLSRSDKNGIELFHEALDGSSDEIMWAKLYFSDDSSSAVTMETKEGETYKGTRSRDDKIKWNDGDVWVLTSDKSKLVRVEGTYETADGAKEHLRRSKKGDYEVFHNESSGIWARIEHGGNFQKDDNVSRIGDKGGDALRLVILSDNSSCDGKIEKFENESTTCITWSDGDKWIRKDDPSSPVRVVRRCSPESKTPCNNGA